MDNRYLSVIVIVQVLLLLSNVQMHGEEQKEEPQRSLSLSTIESRVSPHFEFTLPSGNISERIEQQFNNLHTVFNLNFNLLDSSIDADVAIFYPLGFFIPGIHFYQNVDFENPVAPQFQDGELSLLPTKKFVSRDRGIGLDFIFHLTPIFSIIPAFLMNETFKARFTEDLILDEGIDWIAKLSFVLDSAKSLPAGSPAPKHGIGFSSVFSTRFRDVLTNPVSIDHTNVLRTSHQFGDRLFLTESIGFNNPIYIWNTEVAGFYSLGGFNTIRGYSYGSVAAFRYLLNRIDLGAGVFPNAQIKLKLRKRRATIGDYRIFLILDGLLAQDRLSWDSPVNIYGGCGAGFAFLISGEKQQHLKVSTYVVQPVEPGRFPIFYFQTSFFNFEKQI